MRLARLGWMAETPAMQAFADAFAVEPEVVARAREAAEHLGVPVVSPAVGAQLAVAAAGRPAMTMVEIGTGAGVSGLWLLHGSPRAQLTTIDADLDHHHVARAVFTAAGHPAKQVRFITGRPADVLPRMNESAYDLVSVDADAESITGHVDAALRLVRPGGCVLVAHVLQGGRVANPVKRDRATVAYRTWLTAIRDREDVLASISAVGDGLLQLVRRGA